MKGGRTAPRKIRVVPAMARQQTSFNEGGADCPPKEAQNELEGQKHRQLQ